MQFHGGYGGYGFDHYDTAIFDTYQAAYNQLRRWRRFIKRANIRADVTIYRFSYYPASVT